MLYAKKINNYKPKYLLITFINNSNSMEIRYQMIPLIFIVSLLTCISTQATQLKYDVDIPYKPSIINTTDLEIKMLIGNISYQISQEHKCNYNLSLQKLDMLFNIEKFIPK